MPVKTSRSHVWWGTFSLDENQSGRWRIESVVFWIERLPTEWRIAYESGDEAAEGKVEVVLPLTKLQEYGSQAKVTRFGVGKTESTVKLTPALADRPVVIRPETPLYILPEREITFFVSSPLWVRIESGDPPVLLQDVPVFRPSDTWFGPTTMEGELCYANRVYGRLTLEDLRFRPYRAVTVVYLKNYGSESILLERLNLPVPNLSLYESGDGHLWTQPVTLEMGTNQKVGLELKEVAPAEARKPKLISGPRQKAEKSLLSRAVKSLIS